MSPSVVLVLAVVVLAGCTNWKGYEKSGTTEAQVKQDMKQCRQTAEIYDRGIIPPLFPPEPDTKARILHDKKVYRECMLSRGYKDTGWNPFREMIP